MMTSTVDTSIQAVSPLLATGADAAAAGAEAAAAGAAVDAIAGAGPAAGVAAIADEAAGSGAEAGASAAAAIFTLGRKSTTYSAPRYSSVWPFWRPKPFTSVTVTPCTPMALRASRTSSSLNGLTMAVTIFMVEPF